MHVRRLAVRRRKARTSNVVAFYRVHLQTLKKLRVPRHAIHALALQPSLRLCHSLRFVTRPSFPHAASASLSLQHESAAVRESQLLLQNALAVECSAESQWPGHQRDASHVARWRYGLSWRTGVQGGNA